MTMHNRTQVPEWKKPADAYALIARHQPYRE